MTRTSLAHCQHPGVEAAAGAAAVLYACTEVGICVGCWAPPRLASGLAQGCRREEVTVSISPGCFCGDSDLHARGCGCARETLCAARRGEVARARETLCACHGRRSRIAGALHELWAILVVHSTCDARVLSRGPRTSGDVLSNERWALPRSSVNQVCQVGFFRPGELISSTTFYYSRSRSC